MIPRLTAGYALSWSRGMLGEAPALLRKLIPYQTDTHSKCWTNGGKHSERN